MLAASWVTLRAQPASSPQGTSPSSLHPAGEEDSPSFHPCKRSPARSLPEGQGVCLGRPPEGLMGELCSHTLSCPSFPAAPNWSWRTPFFPVQCRPITIPDAAGRLCVQGSGAQGTVGKVRFRRGSQQGGSGGRTGSKPGPPHMASPSLCNCLHHTHHLLMPTPSRALICLLSAFFQ